MKVKVLEDKCIGCGNCVALTEGEVFDFNDEGLAMCTMQDVDGEHEELVNDAISQCPTEAIVEVTEQ